MSRSPLRSLLVVALIALTVAAGTVAAIANRTTTVTAADLERAELGSGDFLARFGTRDVGFADSFGPEPVSILASNGRPSANVALTDDEIRIRLAEQRAWLAAFDPVEFESSVESSVNIDVAVARLAFASGAGSAIGPFGYGNRGSRLITDLDLTEEVNSGALDLFQGRLPTDSDEIALAIAFETGREALIGSITQVGSDELTVVGLVSNPVGRIPLSIVAPEAFDRLADPTQGVVFEVRADLDGDRLRRDESIAAISDNMRRPLWARTDTEALLADGRWSADALVFWNRSRGYSNPADFAAFPYVILSILAIQVILVAAAAFAVGIRRRTQEFGQLLALGGDDRHVRRLVLFEAGLLGLVGAVAGLVVGVVGAWWAVSQGWLDTVGSRFPTSLRWTVADWLGPAMIGLIAALIAAWWPARSLANASIPSTLAGHTPQVALPKQASRWGIVVVAAGLLAVTAATRDITNYNESQNNSGYLLLVAGVGAMLLGTIMLIGSILSLIGRRADRLPLLPRLVARNSDRQRSRSWVVVGSFIVALVIPILVGSSIKAYPNSYNGNRVSDVDNQMLVVRQQLFGFDGEDLAGIGPEYEAFNASLDDSLLEHGGPFRQTPMLVAPDLRLQQSTGDLTHGFGNTVLVATDELLDFFEIGRDVRARLDANVILDISVNSVVRGSGQLSLARNTPFPDLGLPVRYVAGPPLFRTDVFMITPEAARDLGVEATRVGTIRIFDEPLSSDAQHQLRAAADVIWVDTFGEYNRDDFAPLAVGVSPEPAPEMSITRTSTQGLGATQAQWVALGISLALAVIVALVTSSLAAVEMDAEISSMIATGAAPVMRRKMLGAQTLYHLVIASVLAIPAGILLFYAAASADDFGPRGLTLPWSAIALTALLVPVVVALVISLTFRNGKPAVSRRLG